MGFDSQLASGVLLRGLSGGRICPEEMSGGYFWGNFRVNFFWRKISRGIVLRFVRNYFYESNCPGWFSGWIFLGDLPGGVSGDFLKEKNWPRVVRGEFVRGNCPRNVQIKLYPDSRRKLQVSPCIAVNICGTLVNTQTHTHRQTDRFRPVIFY